MTEDARPDDGRPWSTNAPSVRVGEGDSSVVHAFRTAAARKLPDQERRWVAEGIFEHLRHHTARHVPGRPFGYQFVLSNGAYATVADMVFKGPRVLEFSSNRVTAGLRQPVGFLTWPKDLPQDGGWFAWPMDDRALRKALKVIGRAASTAYSNRAYERLEECVLIDPLAPVRPVEFPHR